MTRLIEPHRACKFCEKEIHDELLLENCTKLSTIPSHLLCCYDLYIYLRTNGSVKCSNCEENCVFAVIGMIKYPRWSGQQKRSDYLQVVRMASFGSGSLSFNIAHIKMRSGYVVTCRDVGHLKG